MNHLPGARLNGSAVDRSEILSDDLFPDTQALIAAASMFADVDEAASGTGGGGLVIARNGNGPAEARAYGAPLL
jgi:hypothetical protein